MSDVSPSLASDPVSLLPLEEGPGVRVLNIMRRPDLNIIVCVDPRRCRLQQSHGRSSDDLLQGLGQVVRDQRLEEQVQVTPCRCIFGCTYGPRIDVARRWSGEKVLYGTIEGEATISRRGRVEFLEIPEDLSELIKGNLPER